MSVMPDFNPDFAIASGWAAMYREAGLQIIPCYDPSEAPQAWKRPKLSSWVPLQNELAPQFTWDRWYGPTGEHANRNNMGIITGACSGNVWVLDLDTQKTPQAAAWWDALLAVENSRLEPETVQQVTGGGGRQLLFRAPPGVVMPTNKTLIGVDIRGQAGFAVMPPSRHESGRDYAWVDGAAPWEIEIAMAPPWLIEAVMALVEDHGGAGGTPGARTADPEAAVNAFGQTVDGRETLMRNVVWRDVLELYRAAPIQPPESAWDRLCEESYLRYEAHAGGRGSITDRAAALEADGRGRTEHRRKWRAAMRRWGLKRMQDDAAKPPPGGGAETSQGSSDKAQADEARPHPQDPGGSSQSTGANSAGFKTTPPNQIPLRSAFPIEERKIPVRDWVVPGLLLRRTVSLLVAPPGSGKSLFTLQAAIMVAAQVQWGGYYPRISEKVLVINSEDDADEMARRLVLAAREMGVEQTALTGRLLVVDAPESIIIAKVDGRSKVVVRTPLIEELVETIKVNRIGVIVVDPFAETFVGDENSNSEVKWALVLWREIARRTGASLLLVHHAKKYAGGMAGDADASRGGGSIIGIVRILMTLFSMTEDEAAGMDVPEGERSNYVRLDDGKANYSKKGDPRWFEKRSYTLNNSTGIIPGDEVAVLVPWAPPGAFDGFTVHDLNRALDVIDAGLLGTDGRPSGQFFTASAAGANAERWAGRVLTRELECSEQQAKNIIRVWLKNDVLEVFDYTDPLVRKTRKGTRSVLKNRPGKAV